MEEVPSIEDTRGNRVNTFWYPGYRIGGISLILGPALLLTGTLLRIQFHFFFPDQLAAFSTHSSLMTAAYDTFFAGIVILWPAILTLAMLIGQKKPAWAVAGATLVMLGLFKRAFDYGANYLALQLVNVVGAEGATHTIAGAYHGFNIATTLSLSALSGWIVLAAGAWLSGVLGAVRSVLLALMAGLMLGILKGSSWVSVLEISGLCVAFIPLGFRILGEKKIKNRKTFWLVISAIVVFIAVSYFLGQQG